MKVCKKIKLDNLNRIEIPKEYRENLKVGEQEEVELILYNESILIKRHDKKCRFCNCSSEKLSNFKGEYICYKCYKELFERINIKIT